MKTYFLYVNESSADGPFSIGELQAMADVGDLTEVSCLWCDESSGWVQAVRLLPQLFDDAIAPASRSAGRINFSAITANPFRTLGISVDAGERELLRMLNRAKAYSKARKAVSFDTDFDLSTEPPRGEGDLEDAQSKIQQVDCRLKHAHMWFWEGNALDKKAFQHFKARQHQEGTKLLERNVESKGVSVNNFSSVRNLGLFYLDQSTAGGSLDSRFLTFGIQYIGSFCDSEYFDEYSKVSGDKRLQVDNRKLQEQIVDDIYEPMKEALDSGLIDSKTLLDAFSTFPARLKKYLSDKFTASPVADIESFIKEAERNTKNDPASGYSDAIKLYQHSKPRLASLAKVLDEDDYQLETLKTGVAKTMQQCAVAYHNELIKNDDDPGEECLELCKLAYGVCSTGTIGETLREDIQHFEEWIEDKPSREKQEATREHIERLVELLSSAKDSSGRRTLEKVRVLLSKGGVRLDQIKAVLGSQDEEYKNMSNVVAIAATGLLIDYANSTRDWASVVPLMAKIGELDMSSETTEHWLENLRVLRLNVSQSQHADSSSGYSGYLGIIGIIIFIVLLGNCD